MKVKYVLFLLLSSLTLIGQALAQAGGFSSQAVREATEACVRSYRLDEQQEKVMYEIQEQRLRNLAALTGLRATAEEAYLRKKRAIRLYPEAATRRLLNPAQRELLAAEQSRREDERKALLRRLKESGAATAEREAALLRLEGDWQ